MSARWNAPDFCQARPGRVRGPRGPRGAKLQRKRYRHVTVTFDDLGLSPQVLAAVNAAGYTQPTPIQAQAIPHVLAHRDVLGIAQTGTGKTASFCLPMIDRLSRGRARARMPRSLILEPTRELAAQVAEAFDTYGAQTRLSVALLIGGMSFSDQDAKLSRGVDVLIATPGRLLDHFERGKLLLTGVETLVIDEADRMLDMGFIPDVERICKLIPFTRQTLFFSATMPPEIQRLVDTFLQNPVRVEVAKQSSTAETVAQAVCQVGKDDKRDALRTLIESQTVQNGIIFCNRKRDVALLNSWLIKQGFNAGALHGDMDQRARMQTLDSFRKGEITLLVASDVAARGLDIPAVSHVFNFDVPIHAEDYVHRIGRTGRAGRSGHAFTLVTSHDRKALAAIEHMLTKPIPVHEIEGIAARADEEPVPSERPLRGRKPRPARSEPKDEISPEAASAADVPAPAPPPPAEAHVARDPAPPTREPRSRRGGSKGQPREEAPVLGLGDHVPAFMKIEIRTSRPQGEDASDATS